MQHRTPRRCRVLPAPRAHGNGAPAPRRSLRPVEEAGRGGAGPRRVGRAAGAGARYLPPDGNCSSGNKPGSLRGHRGLHFPWRERPRQAARYGSDAVRSRGQSWRAFGGQAVKWGCLFLPFSWCSGGNSSVFLAPLRCAPCLAPVLAFPSPLRELGTSRFRSTGRPPRTGVRGAPFFGRASPAARPVPLWAQPGSPTCATG